MPLLTPIIEAVPGFSGRVYSAARLAAVSGAGGYLQVAPCAFVLPIGLSGGPADAVTGLFRQPIERIEGVLLVVRAADDVTGGAGLVQLEPLIEAVVAAVVGSAPDDEIVGTWRLVKGELAQIAGGVLTYQLDFAIEDQLRIAR